MKAKCYNLQTGTQLSDVNIKGAHGIAEVKLAGKLALAVSYWLVYMSQRMTFLYSPRLGNRSSWLVTKLTASISKVWRPSRMPNLDRMIAPTMDVGGYGFVSARMCSKPPRNDPI